MFAPFTFGMMRHIGPLCQSHYHNYLPGRGWLVWGTYTASLESSNIHISLLQAGGHWWGNNREGLCMQRTFRISYSFTTLNQQLSRNVLQLKPKQSNSQSGTTVCVGSSEFPLGICNEIFKKEAPVICSSLKTPILTRLRASQSSSRARPSSLFWQSKCQNSVQRFREHLLCARS